MTWISQDEIYEFIDKEYEDAARRAAFLNKYYGKFTDEEWDEMSNRKRAKGTKFTTSDVREMLAVPHTSLKYNGYICDKCDQGYLTLDLHEGVTPMFSPCFATEGCTGQAHSLGYPNGEPPLEFGEPIIHWYRPTEEEFKKLSPGEREHVLRGGLARKASEHAPDWVKRIA